MDVRWAIVGGIALGAGYWWWIGGANALHHPQHVAAPVEPSAATAPPDDAKPLYRWRNDDGVVQITDAPPPKGRKYQIIPRYAPMKAVARAEAAKHVAK